MAVMRMQNVSKELRELGDVDAPQSMNADVQGKTQTACCAVEGGADEFRRARDSWEADRQSGKPRSLLLLRASAAPMVCRASSC
ncbi:hypothetical protein, conserved [Eimeria necatrix]|uniref:Uncharacterized protein n=1 Tax=Eimeria necatrix TaxID=51315 RepID=U6MMT6_9EIME|nr:hypothetical protein, conserved [Eimeria necatrix]CDJ62970.1 hypothetical protein, conserved [Eimeria necatrix]